MAIVEFSKRYLEKLVTRKISDSEYENVIPMVGCPLEKMDREKVWYEVSPNRPDLYSIEGFARAMRNFLGISKKLPSYKVAKPKIKMTTGSVKSRPFVTAAVVRNVRLTEDNLVSIIQIQEKLHDTLGRKRKKVAIGIHDLDKVKPPFRYFDADPDKVHFTPLESTEKMSMRDVLKKHPKGKEYAHLVKDFKKWPIILDKNNDVLSFPPIINGELTKVTEKTKNFFIDITGTSEIAINQALNNIAALLQDQGCTIEAVKVGGKTTPDMTPMRMKLSLSYADALLELKLSNSDARELLAKMGIGFTNGVAVIPPYRIDVMHQMDLVEDIAIAYGYGNFEPHLPRVMTIAKRDEMNEFAYFLRKIMTGLSMQEVVSSVLTNKDAEFQRMELEETPIAETRNSVSPEFTTGRKKILPALLNVLSQNRHREYPQSIFEIGDVIYLDKNEETGVRQVKHLAACISDNSVNYEQIVSVLDTLLKNLGVAYKINKTDHRSFMKGRVAEIHAGSKLGVIGEIHPKVLENWNIEMPVVAFEINVSKLFQLAR